MSWSELSASELPEPPYLILGAGRAGISAARALIARGCGERTSLWDGHDGPETRTRIRSLPQRGMRFALGPWRASLLNDLAPRTVIKSPGIAPDHPAVRAALEAGIHIVDELELGRRLTRRPLVAVTGTDGKSTVCALIAAALGAPAPPVVVAGNTEFGPPLSSLPDVGGPVVVEASSYQLEFCEGPFTRLAVLTNLTVEHLHRHGSMEAYGAIKRRLFIGARAVPLAAVNVDSEFGRRLADDLRAAGSAVSTFGSSPDAQYRVATVEWDVSRATVCLDTPTGSVRETTGLPGWYNAENLAGALAATDLLELPRARALAAFAQMPGVPGRWESVDCGQRFDVIVDFAHTPAGLRRVLESARHVVEVRPRAKVLLLLCAGGARNPFKRRPFGTIAGELADRVIVTEGNGRGEPRELVIGELLAGWPVSRPAPDVIPDRGMAIRALVRSARPGDVVVLMGRGAMPTLYSNAAGGGPPFDDRTVARAELVALA